MMLEIAFVIERLTKVKSYLIVRVNYFTIVKNSFVKKIEFLKYVITKCTHYIATMAGNVRNVLFEITLLRFVELFVKLGCVYMCNYTSHLAALSIKIYLK
jgi:hypothetical protein